MNLNDLQIVLLICLKIMQHTLWRLIKSTRSLLTSTLVINKSLWYILNALNWMENKITHKHTHTFRSTRTSKSQKQIARINEIWWLGNLKRKGISYPNICTCIHTFILFFLFFLLFIVVVFIFFLFHSSLYVYVTVVAVVVFFSECLQ